MAAIPVTSRHSRQPAALLHTAGESDIDIESLEVSGVRDTLHCTAGQQSSQALLWSDYSDSISAKYFIYWTQNKSVEDYLSISLRCECHFQAKSVWKCSGW